MQNVIHRAWKALCELATRAADGLHNLQSTLGVKQNTETLVRANLAAAETAEAVFQTAKGQRLSAVAVQGETDRAGQDFMRTARDAFKKTLGPRYSQAWNAVGFVNHSLALPRTLAARATLLKTMVAYLTAHPEMEVAVLEVTAAQGQVLLDALRASIAAVTQAQVTQETRRNERDAAVSALSARLRNLVKELSGLLGPLDPRWKEFGFNEPGDTSVPEVPTGLTALPGTARQVQLHWDWTPGSERTHIFKKVLGQEEDFVYVETTTAREFNLNGLTSGQQVQVRLTAANSAGQSAPCAPVTAVVP